MTKRCPHRRSRGLLLQLWRDEGLRVPQRRRRKGVGASTTATVPVANAPNRVWAADFQFDATTDGRPVKIVSIVDEHTRECLGGLVERHITSEHLITELKSGQPWRNGYIESFNSRVRDECLNINVFWSLTQARVVISDWKEDYNHRRHSALGYQAPTDYAVACTHR